jgi:hypothetical protein
MIRPRRDASLCKMPSQNFNSLMSEITGGPDRDGPWLRILPEGSDHHGHPANL